MQRANSDPFPLHFMGRDSRGLIAQEAHLPERLCAPNSQSPHLRVLKRLPARSVSGKETPENAGWRHFWGGKGAIPVRNSPYHIIPAPSCFLLV